MIAVDGNYGEFAEERHSATRKGHGPRAVFNVELVIFVSAACTDDSPVSGRDTDNVSPVYVWRSIQIPVCRIVPAMVNAVYSDI